MFTIEAAFLRGRISRLLKVRLKGFYLVWAALIDQILVISVLPARPHLILDVANLASYLAAAVFLWMNKRVPGVLFLGAGGAMNLVAIVANGGTMPASRNALRASGWRPEPGHFVNSGVVAHPKVAFLGDVFATPRWFPFHDVFSAGDIVIVVAVAWLVYRTCTKQTEDNEGAPVQQVRGDQSALQDIGLEDTVLFRGRLTASSFHQSPAG
ncbi:MAG: DUF5317 domain-containing protein [Acidimicrobiales bacterium]